MNAQTLGWIGWAIAILFFLPIVRTLFSEGLRAVRESKSADDRMYAVMGPYAFALVLAVYMAAVLTAYSPIWGDYA